MLVLRMPALPALPALGLILAFAMPLIADSDAAAAGTRGGRRAPVARCSRSRSRPRARVRCARRHPAQATLPAVSWPPAPRVPKPAAIAVGPCVGIEDVPSASNIAEVRAATLCLVNTVRAHFGLQTLTDNATLDAVALAHSRDMVANDYFDHTSPSGETVNDRITASGYLAGASTWTVGENLAAGTRELTTPLATVIGWFWSPEHRANMLSPGYRQSGIGVVAAIPAQISRDSPAATYTQEFGAGGSG
jgi:uncharacterized protein YkwD